MSELPHQAARIFQERREKAQAVINAGGGYEDAAVAVYGRSDGMTIAAVRDLLRERS